MIILALEDNIYHKVMVGEKLQQIEDESSEPIQSRVVYPQKVQDIDWLQYGTFTGDNLAVIHLQNSNLIPTIFKADLTTWTIVLYLQKYSDILPYMSPTIKPYLEQLPVIKTWEDKESFYKERLGGYQYEKGVQQILTQLLIRQPMDYESVLTYFKNMTTDTIISLQDIQYVIGDSDIYRLNDALVNLFYGKGKRKTSWMLDYFINVREYHPVWIYNKLKELVLTIGYVYDLHRRGVIKRPLSVQDYQKRAQAAGLTPKEEWLPYRLQQQILDNMNTTTRKEYQERSNIIFNYTVTGEEDLYGLMVVMQDG